MAGRLIDESNVIEIAEKCTFTDESERRRFLDFVKYCVKETKTAYDVEKVVEELEDKLYESSSAHEEAVMGMCGVSASGYSGEISAYGKAIEIVRKGGVNE